MTHNGLPPNKCSIKAATKCKTSVHILNMEICLKKETIKLYKNNAKHIFCTIIENRVQCGNRQIGPSEPTTFTTSSSANSSSLSLLLLVSRHDRSRDMAALINFVVRWSILQFTFWEPPGPLFSNRHQPDPHHDLKQPTQDPPIPLIRIVKTAQVHNIPSPKLKYFIELYLNSENLFIS